MDQLKLLQDRFIAEWAAVGHAWGISRAMAQIHALLLISPQPLNTDQIMERLAISRGNAHTNLRELMAWQLVQKILKKGERKEFFGAEKDPWRIFTTVVRERQRREVEPLAQLLERCREESATMTSEDGAGFHHQIKEMSELVNIADRVMSRVGKSEKGGLLKWLLKMM